MSATILSQILSFAPKREFRRCVARHNGDHKVRTFSCWDQFVCMAVAQLGKKESLREVETCCRAMSPALYRSGMRGNVSRSTLADANETRPSTIFAEFCHILIKKARILYALDFFLKELDKLVNVIDSSTIQLSLSLCPWAYNGARPVAGIKLHTQLALNGPIPTFLHISKAKMRDNHFLDSILVEAGAFYVMDKAYFDLKRLNNIDIKRGYYVTRPLRHTKFQRIKSLPRSKSPNIRSDQLVKCSGRVGSKKYPGILRKIRYQDPESLRYFTYVTNNFELSAQAIADLYKARWQIEIFFKWIKQNLRLDYFLGISFNAIQIQIWVAISSYLLIAIAKKTLNIQTPLTEIVQFLPNVIFLEIPIYKALSKIITNYPDSASRIHENQLNLL